MKLIPVTAIVLLVVSMSFDADARYGGGGTSNCHSIVCDIGLMVGFVWFFAVLGIGFSFWLSRRKKKKTPTPTSSAFTDPAPSGTPSSSATAQRDPSLLTARERYRVAHRRKRMRSTR